MRMMESSATQAGAAVPPLVILSDPFDRDALRLSFAGPIERGLSYGLLIGDEQPSSPVRFRRADGNSAKDAIWTSAGILVLLSSRVVQEFEARALTGWDVYPVASVDFDLPESYYGLVVTGRCGEASVADRMPGGVRLVHLDVNTWDGSDLFLPRGQAWILGTEKVRQALESIAVTNLTLEPVTLETAEVRRGS